MLTLPVLKKRKNQPYLAIRSRLHHRHIHRQAGLFYPELRSFLRDNGITAAGPKFMRIHSEAPDGELDIEFGMTISKSHPGSGPVRAGVLPGGSYASINWMGDCGKLPDVCAMLFGWAEAKDAEIDRERVGEETTYACRVEIYHRDIPNDNKRLEWEIETAVLLRG